MHGSARKSSVSVSVYMLAPICRRDFSDLTQAMKTPLTSRDSFLDNSFTLNYSKPETSVHVRSYT